MQWTSRGWLVTSVAVLVSFRYLLQKDDKQLEYKANKNLCYLQYNAVLSRACFRRRLISLFIVQAWKMQND